jgi:HJR/Mrr/RecB family endonuclease
MKISRLYKQLLCIYKEENKIIADFLKEILEQKKTDPFQVNVNLVNYLEVSSADIKRADAVFFSDLFFKEPDCLELIATIYEVKQGIPIVASSAVPKMGKMLTNNYPIIKFYQKPYQLEELSDHLFNILFFEPARSGNDATELIQIKPIINKEVINQLILHSEDLYHVHDRFFEELVAELLHVKGWEVELTPIGADGGIDIIAIKKEANDHHKMLVQAKRYDKHRKVGISVAREILHIVDEQHATRGMIVTTSNFTKPVIDKHKIYKWRLSLVEHNELLRWINEYQKIS